MCVLKKTPLVIYAVLFHLTNKYDIDLILFTITFLGIFKYMMIPNQIYLFNLALSK